MGRLAVKHIAVRLTSVTVVPTERDIVACYIGNADRDNAAAADAVTPGTEEEHSSASERNRAKNIRLL